jgi:ABC-2 type transport system ATP-binding protein
LVKTPNESDLIKIQEIAVAAGHKSTIRSGVAHIEGPADWAPDLNKAAFAAGITLSQLSPMLPSLEETFFEMTGDSE